MIIVLNFIRILILIAYQIDWKPSLYESSERIHMKEISVKISFESTTDQTNGAFTKLLDEVYRAFLGRRPTVEDLNGFALSPNVDNASINDLYFKGKRIGSFATTYILDIPRAINIGFTTYQ